ncbi:PREDICTED: uncharacterized protein LOC18599198 [Theobroma cacao]|uniref:Uncharacterized protein LOC18599198 n=2 Tax=Theobroma cacao TaxID=3641 RepID=A0AB32V3T2_THECC|nr:PREDICTED: uncharacterized protein LOC18599198 [Theobroma cacao]EOY09625.1 TRAF-like superfamily protein, putative [Theobroma cacao]
MMEESATTDPPASDVELVPEKIKDAKEGGPAFHCDLCDIELVYKIAQAFFPGLATACVDNTTGDVFRSPGSVAAEIRKEMVDYLTQRSETFVAESVVLEAGPEAEASDHPYDIIACFIDDFASSKRNLFSRVSGWLLSDKREDKIDDFAQEMEINGFWSIDKREAIVQTLLKNVDFKNAFHCDMKFQSADELALHVSACGYRLMNCENEGCNARFSANQAEKHDAVCPFKIIPCEQKCSDSIMRREMDRHCITVCPMKLVNCPFYASGCQSAIPHYKIEEHRSTNLHSHLLYILQGIHKEASVEVLKERVEQLEKSSSGKLADIRDVRSLTFRVKDLDAQLGPLVVTATNKINEEATEAAAKLESVEASDTNKDVEKAVQMEVKVSEAKPPSLEVAPTNKDSEEATKTEIKDSEAKLQSLEVAPTNKDSEEATKTEIKDSEARLQSLEVAPTNKDSEEALKIEVKDAEAKPQSSEDDTTNEDREEAAERIVNYSEARPPSLEVTPTNKVNEAAIENSVKEVEETLRPSEVHTTNRTSEDEGMETSEHIPNKVER